MVVANMASKSPHFLLAALLSSSCISQPAWSQTELPLPGNGQVSQTRQSHFAAPASSAPLPGALGLHPAVTPTQSTLPASYAKLPLNAGTAIARLEELRNLMPMSRPQDFQEAINEFCDWLADMADAHWKIAQSLSKSDATKAQAESEKKLCFKFGALKRQAMLLKAEFLIGQKRAPEALAPLVDIVTAEPRSATGQSAYRLLQDIGFSEQIPDQAAPIAQGSHLQN